MTEKDIQDRLIQDRYMRNFVIPNFTPRGWWECDLFEVTKAGYFREYEIKTSVSDFKADARKEHIGKYKFVDGEMIRGRDELKHDLLSQGDPRGPVLFWFVTPVGLIDLTMIPGWAGWIEVEKITTDHYGVPIRYPKYNLKESKEAPRLHNQKLSDKVMDHAKGVCYWRMHNLLKGGKVA